MKKILFLLLIIIVLSAFMFSTIAMAAEPEKSNEPGYASSEIAPALDRGAEADGEAAEIFADAADPPDPPDAFNYIDKAAYIFIPVLYLIGLFLKKIPGMPDWLIPIMLLTLGIVGAMAFFGWTINSVIQGVLVSGVTVFANQVYKQVFVKSKDESGG